MAMGLLRDMVSEDPSGWRIESAGTWAIDGAPAAVNTQWVLQSRGIDISDHRSRLITADILSEFNLVLTMERGHQEALRVEFPEYANRIYLLSDLIDKKFDIEDPVAGPLVDYQDTAREIEHILTDGFEKITILSSDE